jgi:hypothetical protein
MNFKLELKWEIRKWERIKKRKGEKYYNKNQDNKIYN